MRYFKKKLLEFSNGHIHLILGPTLKTLVPFYSLEHKKFKKSFYRLHILMFSFEMHVSLRMVENRNFQHFRKRKQLHTTVVCCNV